MFLFLTGQTPINLSRDLRNINNFMQRTKACLTILTKCQRRKPKTPKESFNWSIVTPCIFWIRNIGAYIWYESDVPLPYQLEGYVSCSAFKFMSCLVLADLCRFVLFTAFHLPLFWTVSWACIPFLCYSWSVTNPISTSSELLDFH